MGIDILMPVHCLHNREFSVPIINGSDNRPKINKGLTRTPSNPLQHSLVYKVLNIPVLIATSSEGGGDVTNAVIVRPVT
jgi:hypothetical protein